MADSQGGVRLAEDDIIAQLLPESRAANGPYLIEEDAEDVQYSDTEEDIDDDEQGRELGELPAEGMEAAERWEDVCTGCPRPCCAPLLSTASAREAGAAAPLGWKAALVYSAAVSYAAFCQTPLHGVYSKCSSISGSFGQSPVGGYR